MSPPKNPPSQAGIFDRDILFSGFGIQAFQEGNPDVEHTAEDRKDTHKEEENDPGIEVDGFHHILSRDAGGHGIVRMNILFLQMADQQDETRDHHHNHHHGEENHHRNNNAFSSLFTARNQGNDQHDAGGKAVEQHVHEHGKQHLARFAVDIAQEPCLFSRFC